MKSNEIQNKDEEDMFSYRFIEINPMYEDVEIFDITAGSEEDAFDLVNEQESNCGSSFLLSDKMVKKLKKEIKKVKSIKEV